jgi:hypothetical protein
MSDYSSPYIETMVSHDTTNNSVFGGDDFDFMQRNVVVVIVILLLLYLYSKGNAMATSRLDRLKSGYNNTMTRGFGSCNAIKK